MSAPEICPHCGADIPRNAHACPECGSCEQTGWSEEAKQQGLDLPEDSFDYDNFVKEEFGSQNRPRGISPMWWIVALVICSLLLLLALH